MATRKKKYQEVTEGLGDVDEYIMGLDLDELIKHLQELKVKHPQHTLLYLDFDAGYNSISISLHGRRPETDKEREDRLTATRMNKVSATKRQQKAYDEEKQEFFRLHEKFGHLL